MSFQRHIGRDRCRGPKANKWVVPGEGGGGTVRWTSVQVCAVVGEGVGELGRPGRDDEVGPEKVSERARVCTQTRWSACACMLTHSCGGGEGGKAGESGRGTWRRRGDKHACAHACLQVRMVVGGDERYQ